MFKPKQESKMPKFSIRKLPLAVGLSMGIMSLPSHSDDILFPMVISSNTVTTLLSVVNSGSTETLHYRFYYKTLETQDACEEVNFKQPSSPNDLVTFDVSGVFGDSTGVLFEPTTSITYRPFSPFKSVKPVRAFAMVDSNDSQTPHPDQSLSGEALVIDFTNGSFWGYIAMNALPINGVTANRSVVVGNPFDFSDRVERAGEVLTQNSKGVTTSILPFEAGTETAFLVTPIATTSPFQLSGSTSTTLGLRIPEENGLAAGVMFDRDENPFSGVQDKQVTCVGRVDVGSLLSEATKQYLQDLGGWTSVKPTSGQAIVFKLEYNDSPEFAGVPLGVGSVNNAIWLREGNRESVKKELWKGTSLVTNPTFFTPEESPFPLIDVPKAVQGNLPWPPTESVTATSYIEKGAYSVVTSKQ